MRRLHLRLSLGPAAGAPDQIRETEPGETEGIIPCAPPGAVSVLKNIHQGTSMSDQFIVSASPHVKSPGTTPKVMWLVVTALMPTAVASVVIFGLPALILILLSVAVCVGTEALSQLIFKRPITIRDG